MRLGISRHAREGVAGAREVGKTEKNRKFFIFPKSFPNRFPMIVGGVWRWETRISGFFASNLGFIWSSRDPVLAFFRECPSGRRMRQNPKKIKILYFPQIDPKWYLGGC